MAAKPLLSVIVPVYRVEAYLDRCIRSIVAQTYENLEILLVDDGSPDGSGACCDRWAQRDPRIRVIHKENAGAGAARNTALDLARGELIAFVDSDDYIDPRMYGHLACLMEEGVDIAECEGVPTRSDDCPLDDGGEYELTTVSNVEAMSMHLREEMFTQVIWNKLYRREVIGDIRFPEGNLIDDEFFTYRVIGNARSLVHSTSRMYAYRQQSGSVMHQKFSLDRLQGVKSHLERVEYLKEHMPELAYEGRVHLFLYSIYARQMSMMHLEGEEQKQAKAYIRRAVAAVTPIPPSRCNTRSMNLRLVLGQISFDGVCRLLNWLDAGSRRKQDGI